MKGYRFYAEMPSSRGSKSASKYRDKFTRETLRSMVERGQHCNVIAVVLNAHGSPFWCGKGRDQVDAICPANDRSDAPVELGLPSRGYLRTRCVRIDEALARQLHPNLFAYLEKP